MDIRTVIFYVALLAIVVTLVELYVRMNGIGANVQKVRSGELPSKPRLGPPTLFLIASIVVAVMTIPK